jgi:microcystin-dependent protein
LCDGSAVSRTDYAELYSVIGDTYGAGDGSTTFNLPNLVDKFIEGSATAGTVKSAGLPDVKGSLYVYGGSATGAFSGSMTQVSIASGTSYALNRGTVNFDASASNSIYGNSITVQPPALTMQYIIKY